MRPWNPASEAVIGGWWTLGPCETEAECLAYRRVNVISTCWTSRLSGVHGGLVAGGQSGACQRGKRNSQWTGSPHRHVYSTTTR